VVAPHCVSTDGNPPSSSSVKAARLLLLQPFNDAGTPGRSKNTTFVPPGDVSVNLRSPTHVWFTPTVVEPAVPLGVPSNRKFRSLTVHAGAPTTIGIFTPASALSVIATGGPVKLTVRPAPGVGVGVGVVGGVGVGVAAGVGVGVPAGVGVGVTQPPPPVPNLVSGLKLEKVPAVPFAVWD
jgi:hypothetical protein